MAVFVDPEGDTADALGLGGTPALLWITTAPEIGGLAEGWDPTDWRRLLNRLSRKLAGTAPLLGQPGDPPPVPARPIWPARRPALR